MSKYVIGISVIWLWVLLIFTINGFNDRLQKLEQKGTFTVVCGKYKYRTTTHDYVGYDCNLLGGKTNDSRN